MAPAIRAHVEVTVKSGKNELGERGLDEGGLGRRRNDPSGDGRRSKEGDEINSLARWDTQRIKNDRGEGAALLKDQAAIVSALSLTAASNGGSRLRFADTPIRRSTGADHRDVNHFGDTTTREDSVRTNGIQGRVTTGGGI